MRSQVYVQIDRVSQNSPVSFATASLDDALQLVLDSTNLESATIFYQYNYEDICKIRDFCVDNQFMVDKMSTIFWNPLLDEIFDGFKLGLTATATVWGVGKLVEEVAEIAGMNDLFDCAQNVIGFTTGNYGYIWLVTMMLKGIKYSLSAKKETRPKMVMVKLSPIKRSVRTYTPTQSNVNLLRLTQG